jgi:hypothetical protein
MGVDGLPSVSLMMPRYGARRFANRYIIHTYRPETKTLSNCNAGLSHVDE